MTIFKKEDSLSSEYLPDMLPFRETQIKHIAENLAPMVDSSAGQNTFIFGSPGIGKTATVKFIFREFEEEYPGVKTIYINCWDFNTSIAVLSKITTELGTFISRRGLGKDEIVQRFTEAFGKYKKNLVVCLDEADQLIQKEPGALYDLLRVNQYAGKNITLVMISNDPHILARLESRVISSLSSDSIEFRPYQLSEMKNILSERAKMAISSFDNAAILLAANHAVQRGGDVRVGLQCLHRAGKFAQKSGDSKLLVSHMKEVLKDMKDPRSEIIKKKVGENEKILLDIVEKSAPLSFTDLYEKYSKKSEKPVSVRMFQDYVKHLHNAKMIKLSEKKVDGKRIIYKVEQ